MTKCRDKLPLPEIDGVYKKRMHGSMQTLQVLFQISIAIQRDSFLLVSLNCFAPANLRYACFLTSYPIPR